MAHCALALGVWILVPLTASLRAPSSRIRSGYPIRITKDSFDKYHVPQAMPKTAEISWDGRRWSPSGWVHPRTEGKRAYFDLHIPKTAGCSFSIDVKRVLAEGEGYNSNERCYHTSMPMEAGDAKVVFLRDPTMHVYSQFLECKYDGWGQQVVPGGDKPKLASVTTWLRTFDGGRTTYDLQCYHPYNMQTRALTCTGSGCHHYGGKPPVLEEARSALKSIFFVGIVEHYQASLCLFFSMTHAGKPLPDFCDCTNPSAWNSFNSTHEVHGVPPHSRGNLTTEDLSMIAELTELDAQLYSEGLERFRRDAAEVQRSTGTQILC